MKLKLKAGKLSCTNVFSNININAAEGKITVISGRPGSGKSTLLSVLAGLITPAGGSVTINGRKISECPYNFVIINHKLETYGYISFNTSADKASFLENDILNIVDILLIDDIFSGQGHYYSHDYYEALYRLVKKRKIICIPAVSDNNHIYNFSDKIIYLN